MPVYERAISDAIAQFQTQTFDETDRSEILGLLQALGKDSRHRHVVRRHLEKQLKKARAS